MSADKAPKGAKLQPYQLQKSWRAIRLSMHEPTDDDCRQTRPALPHTAWKINCRGTIHQYGLAYIRATTCCKTRNACRTTDGRALLRNTKLKSDHARRVPTLLLSVDHAVKYLFVRLELQLEMALVEVLVAKANDAVKGQDVVDVRRVPVVASSAVCGSVDQRQPLQLHNVSTNRVSIQTFHSGSSRIT